MAEGFKKDDEHLPDHWLSNWEQKTVDGWDSDSSLEDRIQNENDRCKQKLWSSFKASATSISQLYKEGGQHGRVSLWVPFQNSASAVTILYKDSLDVMKRCFELGTQYGTKRHKKEMLSWVKKRKRQMRRDDLIGYMCGKPPPPLPRNSHGRSGSRVSIDRGSPRGQSSRSVDASSHACSDTAELQPFCDALALQGLDGAMSSFRLGNQTSPQRAGADSAGRSDGGGASEDYHYFLLNEIARHNEHARKRSSSSADQLMDSPSRKRSRHM